MDFSLRRPGKLNIANIWEYARRNLIQVLQDIPGEKHMIIDPSLVDPIHIICDNTFFLNLKVTKRVTLIDNVAVQTQDKKIVFFVRPNPSLMKNISNVVKREASLDNRKEFYLILLNSKSLMCTTILEKENALKLFKAVMDCCIEMFPLENDLLSMELPNAFFELFLEKYPGPIHDMARALTTLQFEYGFVPDSNIFALGNNAKRLVKLLEVLKTPLIANDYKSFSSQKGKIDNMIILDRTVDLLSLFPTQFTFEGLIDEVLSISSAQVKVTVEEKRFNSIDPKKKQYSTGTPKSIFLNSENDIFAGIRDEKWELVGSELRRNGVMLGSKMDTKQRTDNLEDFKELAKQLPKLLKMKQDLSDQLGLAESVSEAISDEMFCEMILHENTFLGGRATDRVSEFIEKRIVTCYPLEKVLRLIALQGICNGGMREAVWLQYKHDIIRAYGYQHIITLENLERLGFFSWGANKFFSTAKYRLALTLDENDTGKSNDFHFVFRNYAPISVRFIQWILKGQSRIVYELLGMLEADDKQSYVASQIGNFSIPWDLGKSIRSDSNSLSASGMFDKSKLTLVVFVGGVTYAEIAALRFLSLQEESHEFVIFTTNITNGDKIIQSASETLKQPAMNPF